MAVELKLKGILIESTGAIIYTRSLKRLLKELEKIKHITIDEKLIECADYLSSLYTGSRYPEESLIDLEKEEGERCVECMEELLSIF